MYIARIHVSIPPPKKRFASIVCISPPFTFPLFLERANNEYSKIECWFILNVGLYTRYTTYNVMRLGENLHLFCCCNAGYHSRGWFAHYGWREDSR